MTITVPDISADSVSSDENIRRAVVAREKAKGLGESVASESAMFLYAVELFRDGMTRKTLKEDFGAHSPSISKAKKVLGFLLESADTVDYVTYGEAVARVREQWGTVFQAYRELFPTDAKAPKTLAEIVADAFRAYVRETGNDSEMFGLFCQGVAEMVETGGEDN